MDRFIFSISTYRNVKNTHQPSILQTFSVFHYMCFPPLPKNGVHYVCVRYLCSRFVFFFFILFRLLLFLLLHETQTNEVVKKIFNLDLSSSMAVNRSHTFMFKHKISQNSMWLSSILALNCDQEIKRFSFVKIRENKDPTHTHTHAFETHTEYSVFFRQFCEKLCKHKHKSALSQRTKNTFILHNRLQSSYEWCSHLLLFLLLLLFA